MIIQVYEIQTPDEAEKCIEVGVNQIGSVLLSEAEWQVSEIREVGRIAAEQGAKHSIIPLFRSEESIFRVIDFYRPAYIHFCDNVVTDACDLAGSIGEMVELQTHIKERYPEVSIMRAIPIPVHELTMHNFPWETIEKTFAPVSDVFLIDTWVPSHLTPVPDFVGITGKLANREQCRALVRKSQLPVILAGGLSPENVYDAVIDVAPAGADSCTQTNRIGVDGRPIRFSKDIQRVAQFSAEVRRGHRELAKRLA